MKMHSAHYGFICILNNSITIALISLVGHAIYSDNARLLARVRKPTESVNLLCEALGMHPWDENKTLSKWSITSNEAGQRVCRIRHIQDLIEMVDEKLSRIRQAAGENEAPYLSCGNRNLAPRNGDTTAYFSTISRRLKDAVNWTPYQQTVIWKTDRHHSFIGPLINYKNGEVTISKSALYFVYASVRFYFNYFEKEENASALVAERYVHILSLRICRIKYGYEQTLLEKSDIHKTNNGVLHTSVKIAGPVKLSEGDTILVKVSNIQHINLDSKGNTFGVFSLL